MIPTELYYTEQHEWLRVEDHVGTVGITDYAQKALGDLTFVDLPKIGKMLIKGQEAVAIESCKAAASIYAPVTGKIVEVNTALADEPGAINKDPYGAGWIFKISLEQASEIDSLLSPEKYAELAGEE